MAQLTREQILARKRGEQDVDLGDGETVRVRGLTRREAQLVADVDDDKIQRDAMMIHLGMVEPKLELDEVLEWFGDGMAGDCNTICAAIGRLSGMLQEQGKDATKSIPRRRGRR